MSNKLVKTLKVKTRVPYGVVIAEGSVNYLGAMLKGVSKVVLVADENVFKLYGRRVKDIISSSNAEVYTFIFQAGERSKTRATVDKLIILLTEANLSKGDCVVALGGGVVSDITGLAASLFKRGIPYINVPTTLLAMADASVGGKSAVDFVGKKNLIGTIYQPKAVIIDTAFIKTLNEDQIADGMAEIIKCGVIKNKKLFDILENGNYKIEDVIYEALKTKNYFVSKDEFDENKRRVLNFGHTFAHAIESTSGFTMSHGKAVAFGMITACEVAEKLRVSSGIKERLLGVLFTYGLSQSKSNLSVNYDYILADKKRNGEKISIVLPKKIGSAKIIDMDVDVLEGLLNENQDNAQ